MDVAVDPPKPPRRPRFWRLRLMVQMPISGQRILTRCPVTGQLFLDYPKQKEKK